MKNSVSPSSGNCSTARILPQGSASFFCFAERISNFKVYGYTLKGSNCDLHIAKERIGANSFCDFLFAYLEDKVFPKWGLLLWLS